MPQFKTLALATFAVGCAFAAFTPAEAGEAFSGATSEQVNTQEGVNIGEYNALEQRSSQIGIQDVGASSVGAGSSTATGLIIHDNYQSGANVGVGNYLGQESIQFDQHDLGATQFYPLAR